MYIIYSISLEIVRVESIFVELDKGSVDRLSAEFLGDVNGVGVEDKTDGSLARASHELRNPAV